MSKQIHSLIDSDQGWPRYTTSGAVRENSEVLGDILLASQEVGGRGLAEQKLRVFWSIPLVSSDSDKQ